MLGSFDECKGSASLIQSLLHSLPMTAKIVHETFLLYLVIFFIYHKKHNQLITNNIYKHTEILHNSRKWPWNKIAPPKKRDFGREKVLFSPFLPLKSLRNTGAEQSSIAHSRLHCVRFFRRKTRFFRWRYTPSVERSTTMSKNSSAFYAEQTTFRQKSSSFLTK